MINGAAIGRLLEGKTVDLVINGVNKTVDIQYGYGDHEELVRQTLSKSKDNKVKYPLVWYVTNQYFEEPNGFNNVKTRLVILHSFKDWKVQYNWFNFTKATKSYEAVIDPVWKAVKREIELNGYIQALGDLPTKYVIKDEPNFGVKTESTDASKEFAKTQKQGEKSITIDMVDGRIIELNLRIKTNCI